MASSWLSSWLESLSLSEYVDLFTDHGLTESHLLSHIDKNKLKALGLVKVGHQNRILRAVDKIRSEASEHDSNPSSSSSQVDVRSNGIYANLEFSNHNPSHAHQSPPLTPTKLSSSQLTSPPAVPLRRSGRGSIATLPHFSNLSQQQLDLPPAVKPRQQSLKRLSQDSDDGSVNMSSLPSATLPATNRLPQKSVSGTNCSTYHSSRDKAISEPAEFTNHTAPVGTDSSGGRVNKPTPSPRSHARSTSDQGVIPSQQKPVPLPRKSSGKKIINTSVNEVNDGSLNTTGGEMEQSQKLISEPSEGSKEGNKSVISPPVVREEGNKSVISPPVVREEGNKAVVSQGRQLPISPSNEWALRHKVKDAAIPVAQTGNHKPSLEGSQIVVEKGSGQQIELGEVSEIVSESEGQSSSMPHPPREVKDEIPPALPIKRSPKFQNKKIIVPSEEVIFELEDEPIPMATGTPAPEEIVTTATETGPNQATNSLSTEGCAPTSSERLSQQAQMEQYSSEFVTEVVPPPPPQRTNSVKSLQDTVTPLEPSTEVVPPPPPHRVNSVNRTADTTNVTPSVPLEPKQTEVVPPPPPHRVNSVKRTADTINVTPSVPLEPEQTEVVPPPPPHRTNSAKNLQDHATAVSPPPGTDNTNVAPPPPPPHRTNSVKTTPKRVATQPQLPLTTEKTEMAPPHPPHRNNSIKLPTTQQESLPHNPDGIIPPLPPKDTPTPPPFTPPLPPQSPSPPNSLPSSPPSSPSHPPPPLPPKSGNTPPPPPPPLSERYDTTDDSGDEYLSDSADENDGKFLSITSGSLSLQSPANDDILALTSSLNSDDPPVSEFDEQITSPLTPFSSEEGTPKHVVQIQVPQHNEGSNIMVVSPEPPQILEPPAIIEGDYANQEIIKENQETDGNKIGAIRGTTPIRSRTLTPEQCDYINQEVLDGDIIPMSLMVPAPNAAPVLIPDSVKVTGTEILEPDYENIDNSTTGIIEKQSSLENERTLIITDTDQTNNLQNSQRNLNSGSPNLLPLRERRSMTPCDEAETALDFHGNNGGGGVSPRLTPELVPLKQSTSMSSICSSGATTPGGLSLDSMGDYYEATEAEDTVSSLSTVNHGQLDVSPGFNRMAASVYKHRANQELPSLPPSSGTFACHHQNRPHQMSPTKKYHSVTDVVERELISPLSNQVEDLDNIPRKKEGYLHKKGGKKSQKSWQKRWIVFNGEEFKYFVDKNYKESDARNHINIQVMIDVKRVDDSDKYHRFDLIIIGRVFQFYADSREDCESWVSVLHAAITRFQPHENEMMKEGGSFHDPEKQGFLLKQGRGMRTGFKERYIALKGSKFAYYDTKEEFVKARPIHILELALANVRPDPSGKQRFIITMHNQKTYTFQAQNDVEHKDWLDSITDAILAGLVGGEKAPAPPTKKETTVQDIMSRLQENPANRVCADCTAMDPSWGVVNLGIMVCIECSGVHRSMGILVSKVRSLELDQSIWTDSLIKLMVEIGNDRSNLFWEKHCKQERLKADVERDIRESFILAKYKDHSWIPEPSGEDRETLSRQLNICVASNNLMRTIQLLVHRADVAFEDPDESNPELKTCVGIAKYHKQELQVELLEQNRALSSSHSTKISILELVSKKGYLYKTGSDRTGWKRRWCTVDQFRGMEYFRSENDPDVQGDIKIHEMLSISVCDDEASPRDQKHGYCFEVNTLSRGYLFSADSKEEMEDWVETLKKVIPKDVAEKLGFDKVGYLRKKDPHNVGGWKRRWFNLKGKSLVYYRREREEVAEINLKKVTELKPPDKNGTSEAQCCFHICLPDKVYHLKAESYAEADNWVQALRHTQVSGIELNEQQTTSTGIPIIVHKCLQFVETFGLEIEGIYRMSGNMAKIRKLILGFNQDARGFLIDSEVFTVHDVAGALKDFFKTLPDPLLTHRLYPQFISIMKTDTETDQEQQLYLLKEAIEQLPPVNRETLKRIIGHLNKVIDCEDKNKMGRLNLVSLFAPTLMTVNADAMSMDNHMYQFACMDKMISCYKHLFEVKDEEEAMEKELQEAKKRILRAAEQSKVTNINMTSTMKFLHTIYILSKSGDTYGTYITPETSVGELVEEVTTNKALPPDHYALYLFIGEGDSYRVLSSSDRLLGVLSCVGSECYCCLKPNTFHASIKPFMHLDGWESVQVQIREKKKWKKYPCAVRGNSFVQFKDNKCTHEVARLPVTELDVFVGMERTVRTDNKNPLPTKHFFWLKSMRGLEDQTKYLCTDTEQDLQKLMAALVRAKYGPYGLQTPLLPIRPPPPELANRRATVNISPRPSPRNEKFACSVQYTKRKQ